MRGYYAKRSNASGEEEPVALRDKNKYSVFLTVFSDVEKDSYVTLAQVFFFQPGSERPARFFVVAERSLSIKKDFGGFGNNISDLKKRLKKSLYVEVFNDYTSYAVKFKSLFGIVSDDALDLFTGIDKETAILIDVDRLAGIVFLAHDDADILT